MCEVEKNLDLSLSLEKNIFTVMYSIMFIANNS